MTEDLSFGRKNIGTVIAGKTVEDMAREVVEEWKRVDPEEVSRWRQQMRWKREQLLDEKGFTRERELMQVCALPLYVALMMGRKLGDPEWLEHDKRALKAVLDVLPEAVINGKSMSCAADA